MSKQLGVRVSDELYEAVESRRRDLGQSRVAFVERALEAALDGPIKRKLTEDELRSRRSERDLEAYRVLDRTERTSIDRPPRYGPRRPRPKGIA